MEKPIYGGIFVDADSICIEPLDDDFLHNFPETENYNGFTAFENEDCCCGLIATAQTVAGVIDTDKLLSRITRSVITDG
jgi:hypothetical protein